MPPITMISNTRAGVILATEGTRAVILAMAETKEVTRDTRLIDEQNVCITRASGESDVVL